MRPDTLAASASAIGALASAVAAITALVFLAHQEAILRDQVQAAYLSNLYSKQIEHVAALDSALTDFLAAASHDNLFDRDQEHLTDRNSRDLALRLGERYTIYEGNYTTASQNSVALELVTPPSFQDIIRLPNQFLLTNLSEMYKFMIGGQMQTKEGEIRLLKTADNTRKKINIWRTTVVFGCVHKILAHGTPVSEQLLAECAIDSSKLE